MCLPSHPSRAASPFPRHTALSTDPLKVPVGAGLVPALPRPPWLKKAILRGQRDHGPVEGPIYNSIDAKVMALLQCPIYNSIGREVMALLKKERKERSHPSMSQPQSAAPSARLPLHTDPPHPPPVRMPRQTRRARLPPPHRNPALIAPAQPRRAGIPARPGRLASPHRRLRPGAKAAAIPAGRPPHRACPGAADTPRRPHAAARRHPLPPRPGLPRR